MSSNTIKKAEKLVANGGVVKIEDDLFQVKSSSDPSKSYFVTSDSCECPGFKNFYKFHHGKGLKANCSHLEAIRIFLKEKKICVYCASGYRGNIAADELVKAGFSA
ncbi:MAG: rhodanese-like domain-containing protein, partial [Thermoproteota archaeon]|nr:rhodanese-like domain-containing protein [Thermoproteota archaeon]